MSKEKFLKCSKRYVISDSSLNDYGFRLLTSGADISRYLKNPVLLLMHERSGKKYQDSPSLPIGIVEEIQIEGDQITGALWLDANDEFAVAIYNKLEAGILRMLSVGANPKEESVSPEHMLPGQTRATVTKWVMMEISVVDIGANENALALYTEQTGRVLLSSSNIDTYLPTINNKKMTIKLSAKTLIALGHENSESLTETAIEAAVEKLANKVSTLELAKGTAETALQKVKDEKAELEVQLSNQKIEGLLDKAQTEGRITATERPTLAKLAAGDFESIKTLVEARPAVQSIEAQLAGGSAGTQAADTKMLAMSWDEIDRGGLTAKLKASYPDQYIKKFEEKFGKKPIQ